MIGSLVYRKPTRIHSCRFSTSNALHALCPVHASSLFVAWDPRYQWHIMVVHLSINLCILTAKLWLRSACHVLHASKSLKSAARHPCYVPILWLLKPLILYTVHCGTSAALAKEVMHITSRVSIVRGRWAQMHHRHDIIQLWCPTVLVQGLQLWMIMHNHW